MVGFMLFLHMFKHQMDAHDLNESARRFYAVGFILFGDVAVEANGQAHACLLDERLLFFVFEKLAYVGVLLKAVQAVVIDVDFPENIVLRHLPQETVGVFADVFDKAKQIGVRNPNGATAFLRKGEDVALQKRTGIVQIFH